MVIMVAKIRCDSGSLAVQLQTLLRQRIVQRTRKVLRDDDRLVASDSKLLAAPWISSGLRSETSCANESVHSILFGFTCPCSHPSSSPRLGRLARSPYLVAMVRASLGKSHARDSPAGNIANIRRVRRQFYEVSGEKSTMVVLTSSVTVADLVG